MDNIEEIFTDAGGIFVSPFADFRKRLSQIKAFVFDWDGVFNAGIKGEGIPSTFAEPDSMGTNLLRFSYWLTHNEELPITAIITGASNPTARYFAKREHFQAAYAGYSNKQIASEALKAEYNLQNEEIAFMFDDVLDLPLAKTCGLRILSKRPGNPLFLQYVKRKGYCDYITAQTGLQYAVREACELMMGCMGVYEKAVNERVAFSETYSRYWQQRNSLKTQIHLASK